MLDAVNRYYLSTLCLSHTSLTFRSVTYTFSMDSEFIEFPSLACFDSFLLIDLYTYKLNPEKCSSYAKFLPENLNLV